MGKSVNILFVDDMAFSRLMVEKGLGSTEGYHVTSVRSANEALNCMKSGDYDVVVTDLSMPGIDGIGFITEAKKIKKLTDTGIVPPPPFILLTAIHDRDLLLQAQRAGFQQILLKPFDVERMREALELVLKTKSASGKQ